MIKFDYCLVIINNFLSYANGLNKILFYNKECDHHQLCSIVYDNHRIWNEHSFNMLLPLLNKLEIRAMFATIPKYLYLNIINKITNIKPKINEIIPDFIESFPRSGPTVLSSTITKGVGNAPERNNKDRSVAV